MNTKLQTKSSFSTRRARHVKRPSARNRLRKLLIETLESRTMLASDMAEFSIAARPSNMVFIDASVANYQQLAAGLASGAELVILDGNRAITVATSWTIPCGHWLIC